jgi:large subunit ribosomal protein L18
MDKKVSRLRRATKARAKFSELKVNRLVVFRSARHIYAQIVSPESTVLAAASTVEKSQREAEAYTGNIESAKEIGRLIAERALEKGVKSVAFDRSGFKYHGRIAALADSARQAGLQF